MKARIRAGQGSSLTSQPRAIQSKPKGSLQMPKAAWQQPLSSHSRPPPYPGFTRLKLRSSKAEVKRKAEASCKVWGKKKKKEKKIMSNYTFTMSVKEANISPAEVASMRAVLDEISSKNVHFSLKLKA